MLTSLRARSSWGSLAAMLLVGVGALASGGEVGFLTENQAAMTKMMAAMHVAPSGDVDRDFVATMVPHHQGAIDMAQAELRYGKSEQLRRLAQEIIVTQRDEIAAMWLAVGQPRPSAAPTRAVTPTPTGR